jgi:uncharacterized RDD family membrane protein YckC
VTVQMAERDSGSIPTAGTPALRRRLMAFVYEGVLLFGVLMTAGLLYAAITEQRHALHGKTGLQMFLFVVLGVYFVWFWSHGGQTVAMKTWRVRLESADGGAVSPLRATARYAASWLWFMPSLMIVYGFGIQGPGPISAVVLAGVLIYAAASWISPHRQFVHDVLCGTRIVDAPHPVRKR